MPNPNPVISCGNCVYWQVTTSGGDLGLCRRHPPQIDNIVIPHTAMWPATSDLDWCGEFNPRQEQTSDAV